MKRLGVFLYFCVVCAATNAFAADDSDFYTTNDKGETVWALTDYLHGTTSEVRALLNKDVDRLNVSIGETTHDIDELKRNMAPGRKRALDSVRISAAYVELAAEMKQADADRKTAEGQDKLDASSRFNKARFALQKMEHDAILQDPVLADDEKELATDQQQLAAHQAALQKALQWRGKLLGAIRDTFRLGAPVRKGSRGLVPDMTVIAQSDNGTMGQFDAEVPGSESNSKVAEGIQSSTVQVEQVNLLLLGSYPAKTGHVLRLNQSFEVVKVEVDPKLGPVFVMKPARTEVDELLDGMPTDDPGPTTRPGR